MNFWQQCLDHLRSIVSEQEFRIWISPLKVSDQGSLFTVYAPNQYFLGWIKSKYRHKIVDTLKKVKKNDNLIVDFSISNELSINTDKLSVDNLNKESKSTPISLSTVGPQTDLFTQTASRNKIVSTAQQQSSNDYQDVQEVEMDLIGMSNELHGFDEALALPKGRKMLILALL